MQKFALPTPPPAPALVALDLFAGTGWGVACHALGITEYGVENMPEAVATRDAAGMTTVYHDVWDGVLDASRVPSHDLLIASPPCQTFSAAGGGSGRRALGDVLLAIQQGLYKRPRDLHALTETMDPRTALVLTPLAHIWRERPRLVALEQVPQVLPVWEAYAAVMREWGYSVAVQILNAEQYGVPQTRRRAILVARRDGRVAEMPTPTHSRYYSTDPTRLDDDVLPWVSMADALGWPEGTVTSAQSIAGVGRAVRPTDSPMFTVTQTSSRVVLRSNYGTGGDPAKRGERTMEEPAATITRKAGRMKFERRGLEGRPAPTITGGGTETGGAEPIAKLARYTTAEDWVGDTRRLSLEEAAVLQSYPRRWGFTDRPAVTVGNAVGRGLIGGSGAKKAVTDAIDAGTFIPSEGDGSDYAAATRITVAEAAILQGYPVRQELLDWPWLHAPATKVAGDPRITAREHHYHGEQNSTSLKLTHEEASAFQTFPDPFPWQGNKGKQFLQVGNAVPPLLAAAILGSLTA